jgi:hypothetical protein
MLMQIWENHSKKIIAMASVALLIWGVSAYRNRQYIPKNSDEFFKRNPHLTRAYKRLKPAADVLREGDKFQDGDYQLLDGYVYPIDFSDTAKFTQADQPEKNLESSGKVWLKSLGLRKGRLVVLAEFQFNRMEEIKKIPSKMMEELGILAKPTSKPSNAQILKRSVLIKLEPRGMIREMYVSDPKVSQSSLETRLKVLDQIFQRLSTLKTGSHIVQEIDEQGYPYAMKYEINEEGSNLRIKASADQKYGMHENESKAAAAGAQGFGQFAIRGDQNAGLEMVWSKNEQRPLQKNTSGSSELKIQNQIVLKTTGASKILWGSAEKDPTIEQVAQAFTHPIDVAYLRALLRIKSKQNMNQSIQAKKIPNKNDKLSPQQIQQEQFNTMSEKLKSNPENVGHFHKMAMNAPAGSEQLSMLLGSLGYEGSEESQKALLDVFSRADLKDGDREKILTELTLAEQALAPEVKTFLKTLFEKEDYTNSRTSKQAALALGSSIAKDGDPETIEYLHNQWNNISGTSKDVSEKKSRQRFMLAAMGNSKSDVFMSEVRQAGNSSDPSMRSAAADSIRFSQTSNSRDILFGYLGDKDPEVRTMVAKSLRYQPFDDRTRSALQSCASDQDTGVKLNCYRVLVSNINQPGIREYLAGRAGSENDPQAKRTLQEALSSEGTSGNQ